MDYEKGKKIFYENFGSYGFMQRNGEYLEYQKCKISKADEEKWKDDIIKDIMQKIISEQDIGLIWNLSCMDISNTYKTSLYIELCKKGDKGKIRNKIIALKNLFDENIFNELISIFS